MQIVGGVKEGASGERGAVTVAYALKLALILVGSVTVVTVLGGGVEKAYKKVLVSLGVGGEDDDFPPPPWSDVLAMADGKGSPPTPADGVIDSSEFDVFVQEIGLPAASNPFAYFDANGNGQMAESEWNSAIADVPGYDNTDINNDGYVTQSELGIMMNVGPSADSDSQAIQDKFDELNTSPDPINDGGSPDDGQQYLDPTELSFFTYD